MSGRVWGVWDRVLHLARSLTSAKNYRVVYSDGAGRTVLMTYWEAGDYAQIFGGRVIPSRTPAPEPQ